MTFTLELTKQQLDVVVAGLGKLPFEVAAPVVSAVQKQLMAAAAPKAAPATEAPTE